LLLRVLLVAASAREIRRIRSAVPESSALVTTVAPHELERALERSEVDVVLLRRAELPGFDADLVARLRGRPSPPDVIVLDGVEDASRRASVLAAGGLGVIHEGLPDEAFSRALAALFERCRREARRSLEAPAPLPFRLHDYVSRSPAMVRFLAVARRVAPTESSLLVLGETGVGKEWLARAIHAEGPRASGPFVPLNCGALPETLLESELFGHERGAYTGAVRARRGYFELAHGGTLFLDEVAELPLHLQVKLLRALEERRIRPLGAERDVAVDVRVIAATNRELAAEVAAGRFRADLYYRLDVVTLRLPPLRERSEDVPELVESYREHFARRLRRDVRSVRPEALAALCRHRWPGNVRELINVVERAVLLCPDVEIGLGDLPETIRAAEPALAAAGRDTPLFGPEALAKTWEDVRADVLRRAELQYLRGLLDLCEGRLHEVARRSGLNPRSIYEKMRAHGLEKEAFRLPPGRRGRGRPGAP